jgi:ABC-type lipoprotein export system ATPase subunit
MALIETRSACKFYRIETGAEVRAIDNVSLAVERGSFAIIEGPSGSGKSTLLALLGALVRPTRGHVLLDGNDLGDASDVELTRVRRRIGFVFQSSLLISRLPVWENITYSLIPHGVPRVKRFELAQELLQRVALSDKMNECPEQLSGGERQRVALARALAGNPEILIADEPTSNLDPHTATHVVSMIQERHAKGCTVVVASHATELLPIATHVFELQQGKLI